MGKSLTYPTPQHKEAAQAIVEFYRGTVGIEAVLLVNSCARGKASRHSYLDIAILLAYDKWIHEQIVEILKLPELYESLARLFEIRHFESQEIAEKGKALKKLIAEYIRI